MQGYFVTGTDTDCGKTRVACALIAALRKQGKRVAPFKPVAAGAVLLDGELKNEDALQLIEVSGFDAAYARVNPYCFERAVAPHLVAEEEGVDIDAEKILNQAQVLAKDADLLVVEGAGGWMVPLADGFGMHNLAFRLDMPVIMVVGLKLGCLNHAQLTEQAISQTGCTVAGWIGTSLTEEMPYKEANISALKKSLLSPCLGVLPHLAENTLGDEYLRLAHL